MIRIATVGDIGSGKSHIAKLFNYPIFNADLEVAKIYKINRQCFKNLKKKLPKYFSSFPIQKEEIIKAISDNEKNLKKITKIIHPEIRKKINIFLKDNKKKDVVVLDIPLLLENKLNKKGDIVVFIQSKKTEVIKRLKKRNNFNLDLLNKFKRIQLSLSYKKKKSDFIIKNNFNNRSAKKDVKRILKKIL
jgi:dephospho-CoA kinase